MRGQTLPLWLGSTILTIVFAFFLGSYGNVIAYQFRAQAAADSVANAAVAIQSQEFNQMTAALYASGVEEYRLRHILESIRITASNSGGCSVVGTSCADDWATLLQAYRRSLGRYDADAQLVSSITNKMSFAQVKTDATTLITQIANTCKNPSASALSYSIACGSSMKNFMIYPESIQTRKNLGAVIANAQENLLPSYSKTGPSHANNAIFGPIVVEIAVCAKVPPLFPQVFGGLPKPTIVVARAAATNAMLEQDWIQPGNSYNPVTGLLFQPKELYGSNDPHGINWYAVNFGGNSSETSMNPANPAQSSIQSSILSEEYSARTGWWGPMPILPSTIVQKSSNLGAGCS